MLLMSKHLMRVFPVLNLKISTFYFQRDGEMSRPYCDSGHSWMHSVHGQHATGVPLLV